MVLKKIIRSCRPNWRNERGLPLQVATEQAAQRGSDFENGYYHGGVWLWVQVWRLCGLRQPFHVLSAQV